MRQDKSTFKPANGEPGGYIMISGTLTRDQAVRIKARWKAMLRRETCAPELTAAEMEFVDRREFDLDQIRGCAQ